MKHRVLVLLACLICLALPASLAAQTCGETTWDLTAGQYYDVGSVTVANDQDNIYVTYAIDTLLYPDAVFGALHVWVGSDIQLVPANSQGIPVPGQFCSADGGACADATGLTSYTFAIPFADINVVDVAAACGTSLYVVANAEVEVDTDGDGEIDHETAFGGDTPGTGPRWWFYGQYTICCESDPPLNVCDTTYAKGGWIWTTDKKSNPEKLPSLNLTRNRWGWAINLTATGTTSYDIWAGAGLNKTANGTRVGTLTVTWDGAFVTVTYDIDVDYLNEVHVYAGDLPPSTIAPGQYGYIGEPTENHFAVTLPLADDNGTGGVWVVAHGVVCDQAP